MSKPITNFVRLFGSGPIGLVSSLVLLYAAILLKEKIRLPAVINDPFVQNTIFAISILGALVIIIWSIKSLPPADRGNKLITNGAFRYVMHPLYAAFLSVFNFGLAVYLNNYIYIAWAVMLHPLWHDRVKYEERHMVEIFGEDYLDYEKRTGRFFPKLLRKN